MTEVLIGYLVITAGVFLFQREMLYHPTNRDMVSALEPWEVDDRILGYARELPAPRAVWLVCHGNGGQAAKREYLLDDVEADTSLYVLEYPGFGNRPGKPSFKSFNAAAAQAYQILRGQFPGVPVGVIGESIGSGPASRLSQQTPAPDKIVLLVPYDKLQRVVQNHIPFIPARLILRDQWDNIAALRDYPGPVEIYAAEDDRVIPPVRAQTLARALPNSTFVMMPGDHDDWVLRDDFQLGSSLALE